MKANMPQQEMRSIVLRTLGETAPEVDPDEIDPNVAFADQFDFDSVNCLDFVLALGRELQVEIPEWDCPKLSTLNGCVAYLVAKVIH
jgi:acyl carrier protein